MVKYTKTYDHLYVEYMDKQILAAKSELENIQQAMNILGMDIGPVSLAISYLEEALNPTSTSLNAFIESETPSD